MPTLDDYIAAFKSAFRAPRGTKTILAGGRAMQVRTAGERVIHLPNGHTVKVSVDDSGVATQIEDNDTLHAIVRPRPMDYRLVMQSPHAAASASARPDPIRTTAIPRSTR
jgi:hypothetical protein